MDENNMSSNEPKVAPAVSSISLDELKAIKKTITPVRSKSEEEMLFANPDIDPNTVYSSYKPQKDDNLDKNISNEVKSQNQQEPQEPVAEEVKAEETKEPQEPVSEEVKVEEVKEPQEPVSEDVKVEEVKESQESVAEDVKAEEPKSEPNYEYKKIEQKTSTTSKIDMSELLAVKSTLKRDAEGRIIRDEPEVQNNNSNEPKIEREYSDEDGQYDRMLDFEKVTDVKKFKLPLNKKPILIGLCAFVLVAIISIVAGVLIQNKQNRVYVTGYELNVKEITGGFVGETVDLNGVYIIKTYSNGRTEIVRNITDYIKSSSRQIDSTSLKIISASEMSFITFKVDGMEKDMFLTVRTLEKLPTQIKEVKCIQSSFEPNSILKFEDLIVKVQMGEFGTKLLTVDELKNNSNILFKKSPLAKTNDGFVMSINGWVNEFLEFTYTESGVTKSYYIAINVSNTGVVFILFE